MIFGGKESCSLSDYEGEISTVIFTIGCPFRCGICYNKDLLSQEYFNESGREVITEEQMLEQISKHINMITAVSISGGEPCINPDLPKFLYKLSEIGVNKIKLDTNGCRSDILQECIKTGLITRIAMDLKGPLHLYDKLAQFKNTSPILESIKIINDSGIPHEYRLTLHPSLTKENIIETIKIVPGHTVYLQHFEPAHAFDEAARSMTPISKDIIEQIVKETAGIANVQMRGF